MPRIRTPGVWMPEQYTVRFQTPRNLEEVWSSTGLYCPVCFPVSRDLAVFSRLGPENPKDSNTYIKWDVKLLELAESAEKGCQFCCLMVDRFFSDPGYTFFISNVPNNPYGCCYLSDEHRDSEKVKKSIARSREMGEKYSNPTFVLIAQPDDFSITEGRYERLRFLVDRTDITSAKEIEDILGYRRQIVLEVSTLKDDPAAQYIKARPVNVRPESAESIEQVKSWISDCFDKHSDCTALPGILPSRVIKILDDESLVLVPGGTPGHFTILSYCWGGIQSFSTTKATLQAREAGFTVHDLPLTLRDAVRLTRALGIEYIWIDSLCIIQDSVDDKQTELPKMPSYYKGSYVTICAAGKDCNSGFLKNEHMECKTHLTGVPLNLLQMPILCPSGKTGFIFFGEESPYDLSAEPVARRAWTFQERVLSPRTLMYGSRTMWLCNSCQISAGGVQDWSFDVKSADTRKLRSGLRQFAQAKIDARPPEDFAESKLSSLAISSNQSLNLKLSGLYDLWYMAVREYTDRDLTFPEDKLPAIAALADEFSTISHDEYVAGLWRRDMLRGLLWSTWPHLQHAKPAVWRAPSWSWASVTNAVTYSRLPEKGADVEELAQVVEVEVQSKSPQFPFGEISGGTLDLRGPVIDVSATKIANLVRAEYSVPGPQDSMDWRRFMMHLKAPEGEPQDHKDWTVPEGTIILALLAEKVHEAPGDRENQGAERNPGSEARNPAESIQSKDSAPDTVDATVATPSSPGNQTREEVSEVQKPKSPEDEDEERAIIHALVLAPVALASNETGITTYERVGSLAKLGVKGYRWLRMQVRDVRIV